MRAARGVRWLAHELVAEVTAPPFHRAMNAYTHAAGIASDLAGGAASFYAGTSGIRRGRRFADRVPVSVGGEIFHGISDKRDALELLRVAYGDLRRDMLAASHDGTLAPSIAATLDAFDLFYAREADSMLIRWATDWGTYQAWWQRARQLREACRAAGVPLASPEIPPLPKTVWQRGADGTGSRVDAALALARDGAFTVMAAMGMWGLFAGLKSLRELKTIGVE